MFDIKSVDLRSEKEIMSSWGDSKEIVISIVCTTYNHASYIEDSITGFLMQETDFAFEIIIHDDASTDGTADIIRRYQEMYPNIIKPILQEENQFSRNKKPFHISSERACGRYIAVCEGDDYWADVNKLHIQCGFLDKHGDYSCCYHDAFSLNEDGLICESIAVKKDFSQKDLLYARFLCRSLTLVYRNVFEEFPEEKSSAQNGDIFLMSMLGLHGKGGFIPQIKPAAYRIHAHGIFSGKSIVQRSIMMATTRYWLFVYHQREGRNFVSYHFLGRAIYLLVNQQPWAAKVGAVWSLCVSIISSLSRKLNSILCIKQS